jgi:Cys-rich repeat protein
MADNGNRSGYDETSARGHCGAKCQSDSDCGSGEYCFPTLLNLCECHEFEETEESKVVFAQAKALLIPYFIEQETSTVTEGIPRSYSDGMSRSLIFHGILGLFTAVSICYV